MSESRAKRLRGKGKGKVEPRIDLEQFLKSRLPVQVPTGASAPTAYPLEVDLHCGAPLQHRDKGREMCKCAVKLDTIGSTHSGIHVCIHYHKS